MDPRPSWSAETFDDRPDHGLQDKAVRRAWDRHLAEWIPPPAKKVADLGCGTGSLAILLAARGHEVVGIDLSPAMLSKARKKAEEAGVQIRLFVDDASAPRLAASTFDAILVRHVLWALPDPVGALGRWKRLLKPAGRLVAIEGRWGEPSGDEFPWSGGVTADELTRALRPLFDSIQHVPLSGEDVLWKRHVVDERYALIAE